jgi:hypothetical protein
LILKNASVAHSERAVIKRERKVRRIHTLKSTEHLDLEEFQESKYFKEKSRERYKK